MHTQEPGVEFDREKLLATVCFIIERCADDPSRLGKTKLHKCLYYADMLHYIDKAVALTGVDYIKEPFGPTARYLGWALKTLEERGHVKVTKSNFFGLPKYDFALIRPLHSNLLDIYAKDLLGTVIDFVCGFSAKEISEISHAAPWKTVELGDRISYATAFLLLPQERPSQLDKQLADSRRRFAHS